MDWSRVEEIEKRAQEHPPFAAALSFVEDDIPWLCAAVKTFRAELELIESDLRSLDGAKVEARVSKTAARILDRIAGYFPAADEPSDSTSPRTC